MLHDLDTRTLFHEDWFAMDTPIPPAPRGFTDVEWRHLLDDGLLVLPTRFSPEEIETLLEGVDSCIKTGQAYDPHKTLCITRTVEKHPALTALIDHPNYVGYAYDVYGDQLKLVQADLFVRPKGSYVNDWHIDGPRVVPYNVFSPVLPLKLRFGLWLTPLPEKKMGNFIYVPRSHKSKDTSRFVGKVDLPDQHTMCFTAGTITVALGDTWHRVDANDSDVVRKTIFMSYTPSWICGYHAWNKDWLKTLTREQRIIMRDYHQDPEFFSRPPAEDLPLYADRDGAEVFNPPINGTLERHKWRRLTLHERLRLKDPVSG